MTAIIGISVGGVVVLLIFLVLIIVICWFKSRNQRMASSIALGAGSPSTKKKPTTPVHRGESSSPGSEHHTMYTMESGATGSPLPCSLQTSTSNMNEQYSEEPRAAGSPSPPPITDPATSVTFGK